MIRSSKHRSMRSRRIGFTLIEVLVVIAIVSLLVAILLPTMAAARQTSRRVACQANLRQIATAWQTYLDQSEGHFFRGTNAELNFGGRQGKGSHEFGSELEHPVAKLLNPCLGMETVITESATVFQCPGDSGAWKFKPTCFEFVGNSYAMNIMLVGQNQLPDIPNDPCRPIIRKINKRLDKMRRSHISGESKLLLVGDLGWLSAQNRLVPQAEVPEHAGYYSHPAPRGEWHNKPFTHNLAFMDTHVEFLRIRKGMYVTDDYNMVPFEDLTSEMAKCQREVFPP